MLTGAAGMNRGYPACQPHLGALGGCPIKAQGAYLLFMCVFAVIHLQFQSRASDSLVICTLTVKHRSKKNLISPLRLFFLWLFSPIGDATVCYSLSRNPAKPWSVLAFISSCVLSTLTGLGLGTLMAQRVERKGKFSGVWVLFSFFNWGAVHVTKPAILSEQLIGI